MSEYAGVIWDNKMLFLINKLENVQIEAARIVTGGTRLVYINRLCKETGCETAQARRNFHKMGNVTPAYSDIGRMKVR
jgi:hypothetical protein